MQESQTRGAQPLLDNFELAALLLACIAQIAVLIMTLRDLPGEVPGTAAIDYGVIERP